MPELAEQPHIRVTTRRLSPAAVKAMLQNVSPVSVATKFGLSALSAMDLISLVTPTGFEPVTLRLGIDALSC